MEIPINELNEHITCKLCAGYLVDATTVTECLHTFCKSCIVKYVQSNRHCPTCNVLIHETQPLHNLRPDRTMQDVVYKLVPGLYESEVCRRKEFYSSKGMQDPSNSISMDTTNSSVEFAHTHFNRDDELVSIELVPDPALAEAGLLQSIPRRFVRCSSRVTIHHLKTYLQLKMTIPPLHEMDILCKGAVLHKDSALRNIWIRSWIKKDPPMILTYTLRECN